MTVVEYRNRLRIALQNQRDDQGRRTWTAQDVALILKSQTDSMLKETMKYHTPEEFASMLSM